MRRAEANQRHHVIVATSRAPSMPSALHVGPCAPVDVRCLDLDPNAPMLAALEIIEPGPMLGQIGYSIVPKPMPSRPSQDSRPDQRFPSRVCCPKRPLLSLEHSISKTLQFSKLRIKFINVLAQNSSAIAITHGTPLNYTCFKRHGRPEKTWPSRVTMQRRCDAPMKRSNDPDDARRTCRRASRSRRSATK